MSIAVTGSIDPDADSRLADDVEMRTAVEQWARARGWWLGLGAGNPWGVDGGSPGALVVSRWQPVTSFHTGWHVSPHAALVWALVLEARPLRDGSRCKRCRGRGEWSWWGQGETTADAWPAWASRSAGVLRIGPLAPWPIGTVCVDLGLRLSPVRRGWVTAITGPCPDCDGLGRNADLTDAYARHVLDAQPWTPTVNDNIRVPGSPASIEALHVLADRLQAQGNPLGLHVALLLAGKREGTAAAVELLRRASEVRHVTYEEAEAVVRTMLSEARRGRLREQFGEFTVREEGE